MKKMRDTTVNINNIDNRHTRYPCLGKMAVLWLKSRAYFNEESIKRVMHAVYSAW